MTIPLQMTPWGKHQQDWRECTRCILHENRKQVVLYRGSLPCDVLLIGEAPGQSENILGVPFVGPAGHLQNRITSKAFASRPHLTIGYTNLVGCIPLDDEGRKLAEPDPVEVLACRPRLQEIYNLASPKLLVCVGKLASSWLDKVISHRAVPCIDIKHPAAILRENFSTQALSEQKNVITIMSALEELGL